VKLLAFCCLFDEDISVWFIRQHLTVAGPVITETLVNSTSPSLLVVPHFVQHMLHAHILFAFPDMFYVQSYLYMCVIVCG